MHFDTILKKSALYSILALSGLVAASCGDKGDEAKPDDSNTEPRNMVATDLLYVINGASSATPTAVNVSAGTQTLSRYSYSNDGTRRIELTTEAANLLRNPGKSKAMTSQNNNDVYFKMPPNIVLANIYAAASNEVLSTITSGHDPAIAIIPKAGSIDTMAARNKLIGFMVIRGNKDPQ